MTENTGEKREYRGIHYEIIRSDRKTATIQVLQAGRVVVRVPREYTRQQASRFVQKNEEWIRKAQQRPGFREEDKDIPKLTEEELAALMQEAREVIPDRVRFYAICVGVPYGRITVRKQKTLWGSCTSKGNLNFNCLLMLAPREVLDSVIVHELCHLLVRNHSEWFYREVYRVFPEYDKWHRWLYDHGGELMCRLP